MKIEIIKQFRLLEVGKRLAEDVELLIAEIYPDEVAEKPKKEKLIKEK